MKKLEDDIAEASRQMNSLREAKTAIDYEVEEQRRVMESCLQSVNEKKQARLEDILGQSDPKDVNYLHLRMMLLSASAEGSEGSLFRSQNVS